VATDIRTTTDLRLVRASIAFLEPGLEVAFPEREELVDACLDESEVQTQVLARFIEDLPRIEQPPLWKARHYPPAASGGYIVALPPEAGSYLRVYVRSLAVYPTADWDFETAQIRALEEIRAAIRGEPGHRRVRLPESGRITFALETGQSEFGDEFLNFPAFLGQHPAPGHTYLTGWVEVLFDEPQGDYAEFTLNYFGTGTPVTITWGNGQQFNFFNTRTFPLPLLPNLQPVQNQGRLNLVTGAVDQVAIFATFQGTTIGATDRVNRIPFAFPYIYPPLPPPPGFVPPPGYQPPPPLPVNGDITFKLAADGSITGFELHSQTLAPVGLFPFLPDFFPGYSFGPDGEFHFANPSQCLAVTPPGDCPNDDDDPDGIKVSVSVVFHPHLDLVSAEEIAPPHTGGPPAFTADGILNAGGLAIQPKVAPGTLAVMLGNNLTGDTPAPGAVRILVAGIEAPIVAPSPQRIYFQIPDDVAPGNATVELIRTGVPHQPPPVEIPILAAAPGLLVFNFGEAIEPAFLDRAPMLVCNADETLNCANQPAVPGDVVTLWATGLGKNPSAGDLKAKVGGIAAPVQSLAAAGPELPGVYKVRVRLAGGTQHASNVPVVLTCGGVASNQAAMAVRGQGKRLSPPLPCETPQSLAPVFPWLQPPPPPLPAPAAAAAAVSAGAARPAAKRTVAPSSKPAGKTPGGPGRKKK
jgi:uncharacterized protein (TIGR03437 family)